LEEKYYERGIMDTEESKETRDERKISLIMRDFMEDFALFVEAGFVAVKQLDEVSSKNLFRTAKFLNPENPAAELGLGYIALHKLEVKEAAKYFEEILKKDPNHHLAKALLGISYMINKTKRKEGEKLIQEARAASDDPTIQNLADVCIDWASNDLKSKEFSPLNPDSHQS